MFKIKMRVAEAKTTAALELPREVTATASELVQFMHLLAVLRSTMLPEEKPILEAGELISPIPVRNWYASPDPAAPTQLRLCLMHPGYGWMAMHLTEAQAEELIRGLRGQLDARPPIQ